MMLAISQRFGAPGIELGVDRTPTVEWPLFEIVNGEVVLHVGADFEPSNAGPYFRSLDVGGRKLYSRGLREETQAWVGRLPARVAPAVEPKPKREPELRKLKGPRRRRAEPAPLLEPLPGGAFTEEHKAWCRAMFGPASRFWNE